MVSVLLIWFNVRHIW